MVDMKETQDIIGRTVSDNDGEKIGKVTQVHLSNRDDQIEWLTVNTGLFGTRESFVPAHQATFGDEEIRVATSKEQIKNAPQIDADGELIGSEERDLYNYYQIEYGDSAQSTGDAGRRDTDRAEGAGHDTSGPHTDDAMTRSKEELQVGKQTTEAGRVRLRKYVTSDRRAARQR